MAATEQVRKKAGQTVIDFRCSHCGHRYSVPESYAGKHARCSKCHRPIHVPDASPLTDQHMPSLITFHCPHCGQKIVVAQSHAGRDVTCAKCKHRIRVPQPRKEPPPIKVGHDIKGDDRKFVQPAPTEDRHDTSRTGKAGPPDDDALHVAPPTVTPDTVRQTKCPQCGAMNRADAQFCSACGETMMPRYPTTPATSGSVALAVAASLGLTFAGVVVWVLLAYFLRWSWVQVLAVGVAALAGYGLTIPTNKRNPSMGILAMAIALVGIVTGRFLIMYWVIMPRADAFFQSTATISDKQVDEAIADPDAMFTYACYHLADELEWDWEFTNQVVFFHAFSSMRTQPGTRPKMPPEEAEKLREAIKTVNEKIAGWSETEKRQAVVSGFDKQRKWLKDGIRTIAGGVTESNEPGKAPPAFIKEGVDVVVGERPFSESLFGRIFTWGGACCFDIIWIPLGLFLAYKIATRR